MAEKLKKKYIRAEIPEIQGDDYPRYNEFLKKLVKEAKDELYDEAEDTSPVRSEPTALDKAVSQSPADTREFIRKRGLAEGMPIRARDIEKVLDDNLMRRLMPAAYQNTKMLLEHTNENVLREAEEAVQYQKNLAAKLFKDDSIRDVPTRLSIEEAGSPNYGYYEPDSDQITITGRGLSRPGIFTHEYLHKIDDRPIIGWQEKLDVNFNDPNKRMWEIDKEANARHIGDSSVDRENVPQGYRHMIYKMLQGL